MPLPGAGKLADTNRVEIGEQLWDFHVTALKIAETGKRFRVCCTGRTSNVRIVREGYNPAFELLRILAGRGSNVEVVKE